MDTKVIREQLQERGEDDLAAAVEEVTALFSRSGHNEWVRKLHATMVKEGIHPKTVKNLALDLYQGVPKDFDKALTTVKKHGCKQTLSILRDANLINSKHERHWS